MRRSSRETSIGAVLEGIVRRAADEVVRTAAGALADEPDGVHQHRVQVRRLRSVLAAFEGELDTRGARRLRVAYAAWGDELGVVRDAEVRAEVAAEMIERAGIDDARVAARLVGAERDAYPAAHARLVDLADSPRAGERARLLREFADAAAVTEPDRPAEPVVSGVLAKQARRARKAASRLDGSSERYHELRKAARRAKYVAEAIADAAAGLFPDEVEAFAEAGDDLHDALGAHRDAILFAERARREGALAGRAGEPSEAYEAVAALAERAAEGDLADVPAALVRLRTAATRLP